MFKVAICDDEATSLQINEALTEEILDEENIDYEIECFSDMQDMIAALKDDTSYNVLLCDILAVGMNGIEATTRLRELGGRLPIIFISSTADYALDGYKVNALRYLKKPVDVNQLKEGLIEAYNMSIKTPEDLRFQVGDKMYRIPFDDIEYLESQGRDTYIYAVKGEVCAHMKFSDVEAMLPKNRFLRCHRSYIVNLSKVADVARYRFMTVTGVEVPISQVQYTDMKRVFASYQPEN